MLLTLQNYTPKVVYRPGAEMYISDTLSRATAPPRPSDVQYITPLCLQSPAGSGGSEKHTSADYLSVTSQHLTQIRKHTEKDEILHQLKSVVLQGWPEL